jgi:hypothetical protein
MEIHKPVNFCIAATGTFLPCKIICLSFLSFSFLFSVKKKDIFSVSIIIPKKTKDCTGSKTDLATLKKYPRLTNNFTAK